MNLHAKIARAVSAALAVAIACIAPLASAQPAAAVDGPVSWAVSPSDGVGDDGRSWVEAEIDPGESRSDHLMVSNLGDVEVTFALTAADGYFTDTGRFNMRNSDEVSVDAGTWIDVVDSVSVPAGEQAIVPFVVTVPENATPGDHAAGIAASIVSTSVAEDGTQLGVESRVGFRVMTRVTGAVAASLEVADLDVRYLTSWNPLEPGRIDVSYTAVNSGNVRLAVSGEAVAAGELVGDGREVPEQFLPGDVRSTDLRLASIWPLGPVTVTVALQPDVIQLDGSTRRIDPVTTEVVVWAVPWPQLIVLLGLALIVAGLLWNGRRRRAMTERQLADAREAGRREALAAGQ